MFFFPFLVLSVMRPASAAVSKQCMYAWQQTVSSEHDRSSFCEPITRPLFVTSEDIPLLLQMRWEVGAGRSSIYGQQTVFH